MSLLRTAAGWFVEPAEHVGPPPSEARARAAPRLAVLGSGRTAPALAAAVALSARARSHSATAVIVLWRVAGTQPVPGPAVPALPAARSLAARLRRRDLQAIARGRLVWLVLGDGGEDGARTVRRIEAAIGEVPSVLALARPRGPAADGVLADRDLVVVAAVPDSPLADATLDDVADLRVPAIASPAPPPGGARLAALAGLRGCIDLPPTATPLVVTTTSRLAPSRRAPHRTSGQASVLLVAGLAAVLVGAVVLGAAGRAIGRQGMDQRAADLAALAGARAMLTAYPRLFEPAQLDGRPNPRHLEADAYLALGRSAAEATARANGATEADVSSPDASSFAPVRIRVAVRDETEVRSGKERRRVALHAVAVAELAPPGADGIPAFAGGAGYDGPLAFRQGKPMRPDVAQAFDRMEAAARADGVTLLISSALRTDAEQAVLFAQHPDPKWVAPPGESLHRYGTELDLGPKSAYGWLAANAGRFHFLQRYAWEPWHYGFTLNARSTPRGPGRGADGTTRHDVPSFVPAQYAAPLAHAAQRWNVSATLLAAQLYAESNFNPFARSRAGAQGIAQFMPGTAAALGLANPFDAAQAIDAQAHLMRDLLRRFAAVPLALAAYNAGPAPVAACACVPAIPETRAYVAKILGLMTGAGEPLTAGTGLSVRLVQ